MDYLQAGYDQFLSKDPYPSSTQEVDPLQFDQDTPEISGSKIQGGLLQTQDGKTALNLEQGYFRVNDGAMEVVRLGVQEDGSIGLLIRDRDGHELLKFTGDTNFLKSPGENLELNFDTIQLLVKDDAANVKVLLGKDIGGF
jgi:hypothetical protein